MVLDIGIQSIEHSLEASYTRTAEAGVESQSHSTTVCMFSDALTVLFHTIKTRFSLINEIIKCSTSSQKVAKDKKNNAYINDTRR